MLTYGRLIGKYLRKTCIICHVALNAGEQADVTSVFLDLPLEHTEEDIILKTNQYCTNLVGDESSAS